MTIRVGFVVNPIAGMGGSVGLKGTDGYRYREAVGKGAVPVAPDRAGRFLTALNRGNMQIVTVDGAMGADHCAAAGVEFELVGHSRAKGRSLDDSAQEPSAAEPEPAATGLELAAAEPPAEPPASESATDRADTLMAVVSLLDAEVDMIVFVGGDGTARDVHSAVEGTVPILGVPAGVKMFSAVFAPTPEAAARAVEAYSDSPSSTDAEVLDVDEAAYADGRLTTRLFGVAAVPSSPHVVTVGKLVVPGPDEAQIKAAIADFVAEMAEGRNTVLGPGSTVACASDRLVGDSTLLGFDVASGGEMVVRDGGAAELEPYIDDQTLIVLSPIGAQGYFLGRGTQQLTPRLLRRATLDNLVVVATPAKLRSTPVLRVDSGAADLDELLRGYRRVVTGYREMRMVKVR